jgi:putative spermidine/putrescine transport system substrate-binding protein
MNWDTSRRDLLKSIAAGTAAIALAELGGIRPAFAEDKFTIASAGGSWQEGIRDAFALAPKLEEKFKTPIAYSGQIESVAASKMLTQPDNPPFSVTTHGDPEAILLADGGVIQGYDLSLVPNYKDLFPSATLAPRAGMEAWYGSLVLLIWSLTYNTKHVSTEPTSFQDMWSDKYRGRVGIPAYGWYGMMFLHEINRMLGGKEDDPSRGLAAIADLVQKNKAVILNNADDAMKAFQREEVVIAPFFNGRTFALQASGVPVKFAYVPCSTTLGTGFVIAKATRFREMANAFVNATFSPEYQLIMTERFRYPPSNRKAILPEKMQGYVATEKNLENTIKLDWTEMNKGRAVNLDRWNKEVLGS